MWDRRLSNPWRRFLAYFAKCKVAEQLLYRTTNLGEGKQSACTKAQLQAGEPLVATRSEQQHAGAREDDRTVGKKALFSCIF